MEGAVWLVTETEVTNDLNDAYGRMNSLGQVYSVVGNHDVAPVNSFPPAAVDTTISSTWVYDTLYSLWTSMIGSTTAAEVAANYGSYSVVDSTTGLRLISINTNLWYKQNFWLYEATMESDPSGQLAWLVSQLETAETAGERVWLMGHMPIGSSDSFHDQSEYFDQIIQRFDATISAVFSGHTHKDEFEIAYSDYTNQDFTTASMVAYIAPALTPTSGNPTFRVYSVDPDTFGILDYSVYYANISSPTYQDGPTWELLYSAKEAYGSLLPYPVTDSSTELTPAFWHNVTALFENDDNVFQDYYNRKNRDYSTTACDSDCKTSEICALRAMQSQYNCIDVTVGINFKRDEHSHEHVKRTSMVNGTAVQRSDCDGSAMAPILSALSSEFLDEFKTALVNQLGDAVLNTSVAANNTLGGDY